MLCNIHQLGCTENYEKRKYPEKMVYFLNNLKNIYFSSDEIAQNKFQNVTSYLLNKTKILSNFSLTKYIFIKF